MQRHHFGILATAALALSAIALTLDVSMARPKDIAGNYNCYCDGGNHGTCTSAPNDSGTGIKCQKGAGDTCTGSCKMITFTPTGGAIGHSGGGSGGTASPGNAR
jgi:hypothetical protein